jgi:hypothetical protein
MKLFILGVFSLVLSVEAFAQRGHGPSRGGRNDRFDRYEQRENNRREHSRNDRYDDYRPGPSRGSIIVGPRYNPNRNSVRIIRSTRRPIIIWSSGFGYSCNMYGQLQVNGRFVHQFSYSSDCSLALSDIQSYGDFCDQEDLYDQTGFLEAQFSHPMECRQALGWYY